MPTPCRPERASARGFRIRARLPGQQEELRLVASEPAAHRVAPESTLQRTVFVEKRARAGIPTRFSITYELTVFAQYHAVDARPRGAGDDHARARAVRCRAAAAYRFHRTAARVLAPGRRRREEPVAHRAETLRRRRPGSLGGRARIFHDHQHQRLRAARRACRLRPADVVADDPAAAQRHSHALAVGHDLFRGQLQRPARLGLAVHRPVRLDADGRHLRPSRKCRSGRSRVSISAASTPIASPSTTTTGATSCPPKKFFRSETVDLQRGEAEWSGGNLYFNQWDYDFAWQMLPVKHESHRSISSSSDHNIDGETGYGQQQAGVAQARTMRGDGVESLAARNFIGTGRQR